LNGSKARPFGVDDLDAVAGRAALVVKLEAI
jgi:hypothetical protein